MTRDEFETFMVKEGWTLEQIDMFRHFTPTCDAETLKQELANPAGVIPVSIKRRDTLVERFLRQHFAPHPHSP